MGKIEDHNSQSDPVLSVIIGIRDWEPARLRLAVRSHLECTIANQVEVVISDYGSRNHRDIEKLSRELGCVYVFTDSEIWSRSQALNCGIVASKGEFIVSTDADIVFSPGTHAIVVDLLQRYPDSLQLKQCRDLPSALGLDELEAIDWDHLGRIAQTRPRWGMGGLAACSRATADRVRGYDERMVVWGAEDNDFGKRIRATGGILNWITDSDAQIFHVWHPPFLQTHPNAHEIFNKNKEYLKNDPSVIRNTAPGSIYRSVAPLVSVVIATQDRAVYLKEAVQSALSQTFAELEVIVVDDGSVDETQDVLAAIDDPRLRHIRNEMSKGVAAARNAANRMAHGRYIAVLNDDDIMLPDRIEHQLANITEGSKGAYGGWIGLDGANGSMIQAPGKAPFSLASVCFSDGPSPHSTMMVEKVVFERLPYCEKLPAGSDCNVAMQIAWHGVKLNHCRSYVILRRLHQANNAPLSNTAQKTSRLVSINALINGKTGREIADLQQAAAEAAQPVMERAADHDGVILGSAPEDLKIRLTEQAAQPADTYAINGGASAELALVGRIGAEKVQILREVRADSPGAPNARAHIRKKRFMRAVAGGMGDLSPLSNVAAASYLPDGAFWVVLKCRTDAHLTDAANISRPFLPEGEDIYAFVSEDAWHLAFPAGGQERMMVLKRKFELASAPVELLIFDDGAGVGY